MTILFSTVKSVPLVNEVDPTVTAKSSFKVIPVGRSSTLYCVILVSTVVPSTFVFVLKFRATNSTLKFTVSPIFAVVSLPVTSTIVLA